MIELERKIEHNAEIEPRWAQAYAILKLARAVESCALQIRDLGNGDAATTMGALEVFGKHMGEKLDNVAYAIEKAASDDYVPDAINKLTDTIEKLVEAK
jgi:hypothetical protein